MRPRLQAARDQLLPLLARRAAASAAELCSQLGVSPPTLHRMLQEQGEAIVSTGRARRTRYALRRALRGAHAPIPLYVVDEDGRIAPLAELALVQPQGSCLRLAGTGWPVPESARDGWWDGLPYPLYDMRPQGYLGRQLARAEHGRFQVSPNPDEWPDEDVVWVLSRIGSDVSGNLILGDAACEHWQAQRLAAPEPLAPRALARAYARLAEQAVAAGVPGSSAAGEFPKFPARRALAGSATPHVLVKFSGADDSAPVRRWADLLVCEHLALQCAATLPGVRSARSRIVQHAGRTFLEVERFDRHGEEGRSALLSLSTLDVALLGDGSSDWPRLAGRLAALGLVDEADRERIARLWWFGRLIANTDMHTGNLSFRPVHTEAGHDRLVLAPAYDMLPMLHAPLPGGELPTGAFEVALPLPTQREAWMQACAAAIGFWRLATRDDRISPAFRRVCGANLALLERVAQRA
ncbi:MAG: type II toxin-antitoxin system HipA family toxin YjjJ [Burkholderiales bacterium]|nr:type II toxin-antitoxin system HipA family toxin YjjJ [Burkholderiales bacterium]